MDTIIDIILKPIKRNYNMKPQDEIPTTHTDSWLIFAFILSFYNQNL